MDVILFNKEISFLIAKSDHPVIKFIQVEMKNHHFSQSYYGFFDDFLFKYGIISVDVSHGLSNKYLPYINCTERNIFRELKGKNHLSKEYLSKSESHKVIASYLIERLKNLQVSNFRAWNSDLNDG